MVGDPSGNGQPSDLGTLTQVLLFWRRAYGCGAPNLSIGSLPKLFLSALCNLHNEQMFPKQTSTKPSLLREPVQKGERMKRIIERSAVNRLRNGGLFQGGRSVSNLSRVVSVVVFPLPCDTIIADNIQFVNTFFKKIKKIFFNFSIDKSELMWYNTDNERKRGNSNGTYCKWYNL